MNIVLSDLSKGMVDQTIANLADSGINFHFEVIDAQSIPFEDDSIDVVIASHMLYHLTN